MAGPKKSGPGQQLKAQLKVVGEALKQQKYDEANQKARDILETDPKNYQALIFLGFSLDKLGKLDEAIPVYEDAASEKPTDPQAWQGLIKVFEKQGDKTLRKYKLASIRLAEIFRDADDMYKCQDVVDKFVDFARLHATGRQLVDALGIILPDSPIYPALEGRVPSPAFTYATIAKTIEADEARRINTLVGERRTRLGARLVEVMAEVKREVYSASDLTAIYGELINWTNDDKVRREYEEKLLAYRVERLAAFVGADKQQELEEVRNMARGMIIIKHPFQLAWDIAVDWEDPPEIGDWDVSLLWEYYTLFPTSALGKVLAGFLTSSLSPFSQKEPPKEETEKDKYNEDDKEETKEGEEAPKEEADESKAQLPMTDKERLALILDGVSQSTSLLAFRMIGVWYQHSEDYLENIEQMRTALKYLQARRTQTGTRFQNTEGAYTVYLATALIYYNRPRNHPESKQLFERVLAHNPKSTPSLVGVGLIDEEELEYDSSISFLERAREQDPSDLMVRSEAAWVHSLRGEHAYARDELEACIPLLTKQGLSAKKLLALTQYRLGVCLWNLDPSKAARKSRHGPYRHFLNALKNDLFLAPAYTSLGVYYTDYGKDRKRAYKCFMKAIELSAGELEAGQRLVQTFADQRDWESIELVAQRAIESGQATPPWGSKKKAHSWPFAALGTAQLHKKEYNKAMMSFRMATRLNPGDYHSFVALAETYLRVRMHYSAVRAIEQARKIEAAAGGIPGDHYDDWFTDYLLANVHRGVGEHDEAIALYRSILQRRPDEPGVTIALMHAMTESADACVKKGLFGEAVDKAADALEFASKVAATATAETAGFWTAVASACSVFSLVQGRVTDFPVALARTLLVSEADDEGSEPQDHAAYRFLQDVDGVGTGVVAARGLFADNEKVGVDLTRCLHATVLSFKRALFFTVSDGRMQAAAYYNLGWAEFRAHSCLPTALRSGLNGYLRAAIRCFKRAIELEGSTRRFWNALGVATSAVHPPIAQHALARSLYLGRGRAAVWANYGTLALQHGDVELANKAFAEGQASDPDNPASWLGQSFVALAFGEAAEARSLAMHALDLSDASALAARQQYAISVFDHLVGDKASEAASTDLVRPLVGLEQVRRLRPHEMPYNHLFALFRERIHDTDSTIDLLEGICAALEADYEVTESAESLRRLAVAKADLARACIAAGAHSKAVECSEMVLQLIGDDTGSGSTELPADARARVRLSAHLAAGLARFFEEQFDGALADFEAVLAGDEDGAAKNPDAMCLFAQVLWAIGSDDSKQRAQDELFGVIEAHPDHIQAILLLGAMAVLNGDEETSEAVAVELTDMQKKSDVLVRDQALIGNVLHGLANAEGKTATESRLNSRHQAQHDIMLHPHLPHGWTNLAEENAEEEDDEADDAYDFASDMALQLTRGLVPPRGDLGPEDLALAYIGTRRAADAQAAIAVAPWLQDGWQALADALV